MEGQQHHRVSAAADNNTAGSRVLRCIGNVSSFLKRQFSSNGEKATGHRLVFVIIALMTSVLFGGLENQFLVTATPKITTEFHSLDQAAWYQASFNLAALAFLPIYGRIYTLFPLKITYCLSLFIFIIGSIVCATSATSLALIIGRAVQGCAHAGTSLGKILIVCHIVSKQKMPLFVAVIVTMTSVASAAGPPLGGFFAESSMTWRFGFFVAIGMALIVATLIAFAFPEPARVTEYNALRAKLKATDAFSCFLILASLAALFIALEWGGSKYPWNDGKVFGPLIAVAPMTGLFMYIQVKEKDRALVPIHILTQRTVGLSCLFAMLIMMSSFILLNYMPFYFQAARGLTPSRSGVNILALTVPDAIVGLAVGAAVTRFRHYVPFMICCGAVLAVGSGLLSMIHNDTAMARVIAFELIAALGVGLGVQLPLSAVRNVLDEPDVPAGEALVLFSVHLGQTLTLPVAQAIFMNTLGRLLATKLPASNVDKMIHLGPSEVNADHMNAEIVPFVTACYSKAVTTAFCVAIAASGLAMFTAVFIEWRKLEQEGAEVTGGILSGEPLNDQEGAQNASESTESTELGPVKTASTSEPPSASPRQSKRWTI